MTKEPDRPPRAVTRAIRIRQVRSAPRRATRGLICLRAARAGCRIRIAGGRSVVRMRTMAYAHKERLMTAVVHPSVDERSAQGGPRGAGASVGAHRMDAGSRSSRSRRTARGAERHPGARPRTRPSWADVGLAVHVLSGCREDHGDGSQGHADGRIERTAVRRRAPLELRCVRISRANTAVRPERLRRDAPRTVRVRREADGGELHDRGAQQQLQPSPMPVPRRARRSRPIERRWRSSPRCAPWTSGTHACRSKSS